ncbi:unnamed protein product [Larinioides sclopetarius]|uniref:WD repeat-containing protein 63 n=1 Tax=Larinioides sclopetarius TaxID=280406 RepID=A0AAV2AAH7_9ARAC
MSSDPITTESSDESEIERLRPSSQKAIDEQESIGTENEVDKEIKDEQYSDFKTKIEILVQLGENGLRSCVLSDCYTTDRPGMHLEILPKIIFEAVDDEASPEEVEVQKPIFRQTVDQGTQASIEYKSSKAQTLRRRLVNSWSQYEPRLFTEEEIQNHLNHLSFQTFRERTEKSILGSLVQNSIADSFFWDLTSLYDEESIQDEEQNLVISGSFSCTESKEHDRMISSINWHPLCKDIFVTSTISCSTHEKRLENLLGLQSDTILFFMWNARNQFFPNVVLEYFDDLTIMKFNPSKPNLLAAGSLSGQLILWDVKQEIYNKEYSIDSFNSTDGFTPPNVRCCAVSSMDHAHKYGITDLLWVPSSVEISAKGEIVKNAPSGFQLVTCGLDGSLHFWDLRMGFQSKPGNPFPKKFNHLNGTWEPFHSVEVVSQESRKRKSLTHFILRNYTVPATEDDEDITEDEYLKSEFYAGCDDGQLLCGNYKLKRDESGKFITEQPEYFNSILEGAVTVLTCSPFISDIFLSAGGKTIAIWEHKIKSAPVYCRERNAYITSGQWSPTRPALFLLGFQDGSIEVWDLLSNLYQPSVICFMSTSAITSVSIQSLTENEHIIVAGDSKGVAYSMNLLPSFWIPQENELEKIQQMINKEVNKILERSQPISEDSKSPKEIPEKKPSKNLEDSIKTEVTDETLLTKSYEEFLSLQEQELKKMSLNLEDEDVLSNE